MDILSRFKRKIRILSIDGGGIRGYIPALILEELSNILLEQGKSPHLSRHFDIIAGTSSGSLTALALAAPKEDPEDSGSFLPEPEYSCSDIVNTYETRSVDIFPKIPIAQIQYLKQAFHDKYDDEGLEEVLEDIFGKRTVKDSLTDFLISSYDLKSGRPVMIRKSILKTTEENFYMKDVARGSSAAPTFFEPHYMKSLSGKTEYYLIDGAMAANNPSLCAYVEARSYFPDAGNFMIFSVGTGKLPPQWDYRNAKNWGLLEWISPQNGAPLYSILAGSQEQCLDSQIRAIPNLEYYRINPAIGKENANIDDASIENMVQLKRIAQKAIDKNRNMLTKIADIL